MPAGVNTYPVKHLTGDNHFVGLGEDNPLGIGWDTVDANAGMAKISLPVAGSGDVPVVAVGIGLDNRDLGSTGPDFSGFTQTFLGIIDADYDSYVGFHFNADDVAVIRMRLANGTVRVQTIPDVASDTFAMLGATQTFTGTNTFTGETRLQGQVYVGTATANANMTRGVHIDQGTADNEALAFASPGDVAHGVTSEAITSVFGAFRKEAGTGGLRLTVIQGGTGTDTPAFRLIAIAGSESTVKSTAAIGIMTWDMSAISGTGAGNNVADANLLVVRARAAGNYVARTIFDADGDNHQDVGTSWTNFDKHDVPALLDQLALGVAAPGDPLRQQFGEILRENKVRLAEMGIVTFNDGPTGQIGSPFINWSRANMLVIGAVRQLHHRLQVVEAENRELQRQLIQGHLAAGSV